MYTFLKRVYLHNLLSNDPPHCSHSRPNTATGHHKQCKYRHKGGSTESTQRKQSPSESERHCRFVDQFYVCMSEAYQEPNVSAHWVRRCGYTTVAVSGQLLSSQMEKEMGEKVKG